MLLMVLTIMLWYGVVVGVVGLDEEGTIPHHHDYIINHR